MVRRTDAKSGEKPPRERRGDASADVVDAEQPADSVDPADPVPADLASISSLVIGPVEVGQVAHGGSCVARLDGRVVFIRHTLPGEQVMIKITDASRNNYWLADAVEIIKPSPSRAVPRCPLARPGGCGGCDWQHATKGFQRELKRRVVAEQLAHLASYDWNGWVEDIEPEFGWRTRMRYIVTDDGKLAMRKHRCADVIEMPRSGCAIATEKCRISPAEHSLPAGEALAVDVPSGLVVLTEGSDVPTITQRALDRDWQVWADGFWQVHPAAADILVQAVLSEVQPKAMERVYDLYCGVGLFAGAFAAAGCIVTGIEVEKQAVTLAKKNVPQAQFLSGDVGKRLRHLPRAADIIVVDPPRSGAGRVIMHEICSQPARAIAYVACDPVALARDVSIAQQLGWRIASLRAFDLFPQTHHVECVAVLVRDL